jgi:hypothetical protein
MSERGIDVVRGDSYVKLELSEQQVHTLQTELAHHMNACFHCGKTSHYASDCLEAM